MESTPPSEGTPGGQPDRGPQSPPPPPGQSPQAPPSSPQAPGPEAPPGGPAAPAATGYQQPAPSVFAGQALASWGSRVGAQILDGIISALPIWIGVGLVVADQAAVGVVLILLGLVAVFLYYPLTMSRGGERNGQTLGKQVLGIRAVRDNGQPFDFGSALLREFAVKYLLFQVVGGFFFGIPWLVDVLWPLWDDQNRALHDMVVSTHVVKA